MMRNLNVIPVEDSGGCIVVAVNILKHKYTIKIMGSFNGYYKTVLSIDTGRIPLIKREV